MIGAAIEARFTPMRDSQSGYATWACDLCDTVGTKQALDISEDLLRAIFLGHFFSAHKTAEAQPLTHNQIESAWDEEWRDIDGFVGIYQVSSLGRVKALEQVIPGAGSRSRKTKERLLKIGPGQKVTLALHGQSGLVRKVEELVLEAFVGPRPELFECFHEDQDPTNNAIDNLYWDYPIVETNLLLDEMTYCPAGHPQDAFSTNHGSEDCRPCRWAEESKDVKRLAKEDRDRGNFSWSKPFSR